MFHIITVAVMFILFLKIIDWSIGYLQHCVSFSCTANESIIYTKHLFFFQILSPYRILQRIEQSLLYYTIGLYYLFYIQQCVYMSIPVSLFIPTLCDPMNYAVHGILQARVLEWVAISFSMGFFQSGDQTQISHITGRFFIS